jgi:8-oxo-dGTP pyrophosphatase MutT (NUDIX family)
LLIKNLIGHQQWTLPGGGIHKNESTFKAASRELNEELNLQLNDNDFNHLVSFPYNGDDGINWQATILRAKLKQTPIKYRKWEIIEADWFKLDDLPTNQSPLLEQVLSTVEVSEELA